jgi:hypothetical protein
MLIVALALFTAVTTNGGGAHEGCTRSGHTGEGFPAYTCADGHTYYADLDGDGRDPATIGRWIETNPAWITE